MKRFISILLLVLCSVVHAQVYNRNNVVFPKTGAFKLDAATQTRAGAMSAADKQRLDSINTGGIGSVKAQVTITQLRAISGSSIESIIKTNINTIDGNWYYDPTDTTTPDDSATVVVTTDNKRLKRFMERYVSVKYFGAKGNDSDNDYLPVQRAIDYCVSHSINTVYFPAGTYRNNTKMWLVMKDTNHDLNAEYVSIELTGPSTAFGGGGGNETTLRAMFVDNPLIGIQRGKGCKISNLVLLGRNAINFTQVAQCYLDTSSYNYCGARTNTESPYTALAFDPFGNGTPSGNRYPGWSAYYPATIFNSGSTDCFVNNVTIDGFYVNIIITPNVSTQNAENIRFDNIWLGNCYIGLQICQDQSRNVTIQNVKAWNSVRTVFSTSGFGRSTGSTDCAIIDNANIAGTVYQIFYCGGFQFKANNVYAESIFTIGYIFAHSASITNSYLNFADMDANLDSNRYPNDILRLSSSTLTFDNCNLNYYTGPDLRTPLNIRMNDFAKVSFNNCYLGNEFSEAYSTSGYNTKKITYENCTFWNFAGILSSTPEIQSDNLSRDYFNSSIYWVNYGKEWNTWNSYERRTLIQSRRSTVPFVRYLPMGTLNVSTTPGNKAIAPSSFTGGVWGFLRNLVVKGQASGHSDSYAQVARIDSITSAGVIYFSKTTKQFTAGSWNLYYPVYSRIQAPLLASVSSASKTVSNVINETGTAVNYGAGKIVFIDGMPAVVVASSSGSFTLSRAPGFTNSRAVLTEGLDYEEYGQAASRPDSAASTNKIFFTKGSQYRNTSGFGAGGWVCTKSGVTSTSYVPEFSTY